MGLPQLPPEFSLLHSELNSFLFATFGKEESGAPLSVLSALTRLDIDPWAEGARLSRLSKEDAARELTPLIAAFPEEERRSGAESALRHAGSATGLRRLASAGPRRNRVAPADLCRSPAL